MGLLQVDRIFTHWTYLLVFIGLQSEPSYYSSLAYIRPFFPYPGPFCLMLAFIALFSDVTALLWLVSPYSGWFYLALADYYLMLAIIILLAITLLIFLIDLWLRCLCFDHEIRFSITSLYVGTWHSHCHTLYHGTRFFITNWELSRNLVICCSYLSISWSLS